MATYWVSINGDNTTGATYANAKTTVAGGLALLTTKGDILNIVNDGDNVWPTARTAMTSGIGDDWTTFGFKIRGTNSSGVPAMATIKPSGADGFRYGFRLGSGAGYILVDNLIFDASAYSTDVNDYVFAEINSNGAGPIKFRGCAMIGGASGTVPTAARSMYESGTPSTTDNVHFEYCYWQNSSYPTGSAYGKGWSFDYCVGIWDADGRTGSWMNQGAWTTAVNTAAITHCTFYENAGSGVIQRYITYQPSIIGDIGTFDLHSNLLWVNTTNAVPGINFIYGGATAASVTNAGTLGYNVLLGGPDISSGDISGTQGWYGVPWDSGSDTYATDEVHYGVAAATVFLAPTSTYAWTVTNGLTITILYNLQPRIYMTSGLSGSTPGALPAASTTLDISIAADRTAPAVSDTVVYTTTVTNTGYTASSIVVDAPIPTGLTYVSHVAATGTYDYATGQWDITSLADGVSTTLVVTVIVDADQAGETIAYPVEITSSDPESDGTTTDSVNITIKSTGTVPYLDTEPLYTSDRKMYLNVSFQLTKNRVPNHYRRVDDEGVRWREFKCELRTIPASTTVTFTSAIETGEYLLIEVTDGEVEVSLSTDAVTDKFFPEATAILVSRGEFQVVKLRNPSATATATVLITEVD